MLNRRNFLLKQNLIAHLQSLITQSLVMHLIETLTPMKISCGQTYRCGNLSYWISLAFYFLFFNIKWIFVFWVRISTEISLCASAFRRNQQGFTSLLLELLAKKEDTSSVSLFKISVYSTLF